MVSLMATEFCIIVALLRVMGVVLRGMATLLRQMAEELRRRRDPKDMKIVAITYAQDRDVPPSDRILYNYGAASSNGGGASLKGGVVSLKDEGAS